MCLLIEELLSGVALNYSLMVRRELEYYPSIFQGH
jgi:hypothetical protein